MTIELNLPPDLTEQLQKMAENNHVSVDRLIESVLNDYVSESQVEEDDDIDYDLTPEELTELKTSIAEAEAENVWYSQEDINQMLAEMTERYSQNRNNHGS